MEEYFNSKTIIEDEIYKAFKETVTCPLCKNILIEPLICMKCQKIYCKKCINNLDLDNKKCPNNCIEPFFENCLGISEILSKLKFKCEKCEKQIEYNDAQNHYKFHLRNLSEEEIQKIRKDSFDKIINGNPCITSKKNTFFLLL